jgi:hypothetical protein
MKTTTSKFHILLGYKVCKKVQLLILGLAISVSTQAANYFWVGGSGNWIDFSNHWATTSGGSTFHTSVPGINDDVIFDDNSFPFFGTDTVFVFQGTLPSCRNFSFFNSIPVARAGFASTLVGGSFIPFSIRGNIGIQGPIADYSTNAQDVPGFSCWSNQAVQYILTSGYRMNLDLYSSNTATYNLQDDFNGSFLVRGGRLNTNGHSLTMTSFLSRVENTGIIDFGTSTVNSTIDSLFSLTCCCGGIMYAENATFNLPVSDFFHNYNSTVFLKIKQINARNIYSIGDTIGVCNVTSTASLTNCSINELNLNGSNATLFNDSFPTLSTSPYNQIAKLVLNADSCHIEGNASGLGTIIDSLIVNSNCKHVVLQNGKYTQIGPFLEINRAIGNYLSIRSSLSGAQANLSKNAALLCFDSLSIKDINFSGSAQFKAGINSIDLGGNSNISFSSCPISNDVWPGDANSDLVANNFDLLLIGLAYGDTGPIRTGASLIWAAQPATDWLDSIGYVNNKHVDCNGDGIVNSDDTLAILTNYGLTHPRGNLLAHNISNPPLYFELAIDTAGVGDTLSFVIGLGTAVSLADSIYGIAFSINYESSVVDSASAKMSYDSCWVGTQNLDMITLQKDNYIQGKISGAITGIDHMNRMGYGAIGILSLDMKDDLSGRDSIFKTLHLVFSDVKVIDKDGNERQVNIVNDSIVIGQDITKVPNSFLFKNEIVISPNPANNFVEIKFGKATNSVSEVSIYNTYGERVKQNTVENESLLNLSIDNLSAGIYFVKVNTKAGIVVKKLTVSK